MDELKYILERIESMDEKFDTKLDKILVQTTKTNGRVNGLEDWRKSASIEIEQIKEHNNINKGRDKTLWVVITAIGSVVGIYIGYILSNHH